MTTGSIHGRGIRASWRQNPDVPLRSKVEKVGEYKRVKLRKSRKQKGLPTSFPADRVRAHVTRLYNIGFSDLAIAAAAGVSPATVHTIRETDSELTQFNIGARLMAVTHTPVPAQAGTSVPSIGTSRRLNALQAIGWPRGALAEYLQVTDDQVSSYTRRRRNLYSTWAAVKTLYEDLSATPGPSNKAINWARRKGYAPPIAWEGRDIDHPDHEPDLGDEAETSEIDEVLLARILRGEHQGDVPDAERKAVLNHAVENGWSGAQVAEVLNLKKATGDRALVRYRAKLRQDAA